MDGSYPLFTFAGQSALAPHLRPTGKFIVDIAGKLPTIIAEYSDPNSFTNSYIYADAQILVQYARSPDPNAAADKYYYVHDRLGSVRMVVDCNTVAETVTARNTYTYSPFGNPYAGELAETVYNPFQFTGQWLDVEIDQYYLRARMYDPTMMRFTTRDPAEGTYAEPLTLHKYLYCLNDPANRVDFSGAYSDAPWWGQWEFWSEFGNEVIKGAAAAADGFNPIPFLNMFESVYANADGSVDPIYKKSRLMGSGSRIALSFAVNTWAVNQLLAGSSATGGAATIAERLFIGAVWKGQIVKNGLGMTAATAISLFSVAGATDNILDFLDVFD